jgi:hypothetical protein
MSNEILVYEETAWKLNEMEYWGQTKKLYDADAKVRCQSCQWIGEQQQLEGYGEQDD